jgi:hypothetical protein
MRYAHLRPPCLSVYRGLNHPSIHHQSSSSSSIIMIFIFVTIISHAFAATTTTVHYYYLLYRSPTYLSSQLSSSLPLRPSHRHHLGWFGGRSLESSTRSVHRHPFSSPEPPFDSNDLEKECQVPVPTWNSPWNPGSRRSSP